MLKHLNTYRQALCINGSGPKPSIAAVRERPMVITCYPAKIFFAYPALNRFHLAKTLFACPALNRFYLAKTLFAYSAFNRFHLVKTLFAYPVFRSFSTRYMLFAFQSLPVC